MSATKTMLGPIGDVPIFYTLTDQGAEIVRFLSCANIDADGSGSNPDKDPDFQNDTTLHVNGRALNADTEPFVVVPPLICQRTRNKVLGSLCLVENTMTQQMSVGVVGDIGPHNKIGEISPALARQLSVDPNARTGGESRKIIRYTIFAGVPAVIGAQSYELQSFGG